MTEFSVRGANVVVVGAARSGVGAARRLAGRGAHVTPWFGARRTTASSWNWAATTQKR